MPLERRLESVEEIVKLCLRFGSHLDEVNGSGQTVVDLADSEEMKGLVRQYNFNCTSLKCLASKVIVQRDIDYEESGPYLSKYIRLHDRRKGC